MKKQYTSLTCDTDYFSARQEGAVVIFNFKGNQLLASTMLQAKQAVINFLNFAEEDTEARIVVIMPQERKVQREEFLSFFDMVRSSRISRNSVMRLYRAIDQFVLHILRSDLLFISVDYGCILPLFASISMACDYRILGDDALFQNPALELGLVPKGGAAWFLKQLLGPTKTLELILANEQFTAHDAKELGIVNRCVPVKELEETALSVARQFEKLPETSLRTAKRLVNNTAKTLEEYLEFENQELFISLVNQRQIVL